MMFSESKKSLKESALGIFSEIFPAVDPAAAMRRAVAVEGGNLMIFDEVIEIADISHIYAIGFGKAGLTMAAGLDNILGSRISAGIISAPAAGHTLSAGWRLFNGGHPVPNRESLAAAQAVVDLLGKADKQKALVIFLISGGGSAMIELPVDERITLADLQQTNRILVNCGAPIAEINRFRRSLSKIKGGGMSRLAPHSRQISLIVADTNEGEIAAVASGPTITSAPTVSAAEALEIAVRYEFLSLLPESVHRFLANEKDFPDAAAAAPHSVYTLLDNRTAVEAAAASARRRGFIVEIADDLVETPVAAGCREMAARLVALQTKHPGKKTAIISGGEFACPVRGTGTGGRNLETTLRCCLELKEKSPAEFCVLSGGTDGIDGNSPAAGAVADRTTLSRAADSGLDPVDFLENSDAYTFFRLLGDTIETGPTGTNVRDVRILLSSG